MLGTVDRTRIGALLEALAAGDGARLMAEIDALAEVSPDWSGVLGALLGALILLGIVNLIQRGRLR